MKNLKVLSVVSSLATLALISLMGAAQASQLPTGKTAEIFRADLDPQLTLPTHKIEGVIELDTIRREAGLSLVAYYPDRVCEIGRICPAFLPAPVDFHVTLPIVYEEVDSCNVKTIIAREDHRPVDGNFAQLTITDASRIRGDRQCDGIRYAAPVVAEYVTISAGMGGPVVRTSSMFSAYRFRGALAPVVPFEAGVESAE